MEILKALKEQFDPSHRRNRDPYLGDMVYGGLDGIITTFAVVSGVAGAELGSGIILIMGLANLLADGVSMGVGAFLSARSETEVYQKERRRTAEDIEEEPQEERENLVDVYEQEGYTEDEAEKLVRIISREKQRWVDAMMDGEGIAEDKKKPVRRALVTLGSFVLAGAVPLLVYLAGIFIDVPTGMAFPISIGLSGLALFILGAMKVLVTEQNVLKSGLETLVVGGLAAVVAYVVGMLLKGFGNGM